VSRYKSFMEDALGQLQDGLELQAIRLVTDEDWLSCKSDFEELESCAEINPWNTWFHAHLSWRIGFSDAICWCIGLKKEGKLLAAAILREETMQRRWGKIKALRSFDWMALSLPPFIIRRGYETKACEFIVRAMPAIGLATNSDLFCFYEAPQSHCQPFVDQLFSRNKAYRIRTTSYNQLLAPALWTEHHNSKKQIRNKNRTERMIEEELGKKTEYVRFRGDVLAELKTNGLWQQFIELIDQSWQRRYQQDVNQQGASNDDQYLLQSAEEWSRRGWLDFSATLYDGRIAAALFSASFEGRVWFGITMYDQNLEKFSVGSLNLTNTLLNSIERKDKMIEFGGEAIEWKRRWSTHEDPLYQIDVFLSGVKSAVWGAYQRYIKRNRIDSMFYLHKVQSKKEFEQFQSMSEEQRQKLEPKRNEPKPIITPLTTEEDWLAIKDKLEDLERRCTPNPWALWESQFCLWKHFFKEQRCWFIEIENPPGRPKGLLTAALWLEVHEKRRNLDFKILRSLDLLAMRLPPFYMPIDQEHEACRAMADAMPAIADATGADLVSLYRQDEKPGILWCQELKRRRILHRQQVFTHSNFVHFSGSFQDYMNQRRKSIPKNLKAAQNKIERDFGAPPVVKNFHGNIFKKAENETAWSYFEDLRWRSWQYARARSKSKVDTDVLSSYTLEMAKIWARRNWLDLCLISVNGLPVSATLGITAGNVYYSQLTAYDRKYRKYSVGTLLFPFELECASQRGDKIVELGGEGSTWKSDWSNATEPLYLLEWPLTSIKATIWTIFQQVRNDDLKLSKPIR